MKIEFELGQISLTNNWLKIANKSTGWLTKNDQLAFFVKKNHFLRSLLTIILIFFYFDRFQIFMNHYPVHTLRVLSIQAEILSLSFQKWVKLEKIVNFWKKLEFWQNFNLSSNFTKNKRFLVIKRLVMTSLPVKFDSKVRLPV